MVWALFPVEPVPGSQSYYIFRKGTYKVGRKDCDVVIQIDRAISRLHAEIIVDTMSQSPLRNKSALSLRIRDHSKFGTFINKDHQTMPIHSFPNKEATLKDGDMISFGTGNASFRFTFVSFIIFIGGSKKLQKDKSLQASLSSIGARTTVAWDPDCTHVLAEESSKITADLINAIAAEKPIIISTWFTVLAEKSVCSDIPNFNNYTPTLSLDGVSVKVVEPKARRNCLEGYTFILGSTDMYMFSDKLASLLKVAGANIILASEVSSDSQSSPGETESKRVLVIPRKSFPEFKSSNQLKPLCKITEMELLVSVLSGNLDSSKVEPPAILLSSSHTTDETIVADSDVEIDTATSVEILQSSTSQNVLKHESRDDLKLEVKERVASGNTEASPKFGLSSFRSRISTVIALEETRSQDHDAAASQQQSLGISSNSIGLSQKLEVLHSRHKDDPLVTAKSEYDDPGSTEHHTTDIIYSKKLIIRDLKQAAPFKSAKEGQVNFKRFRKNDVQSGNSFNSLIPFAKDPYRESDAQYDANAFLREEKKRKKMEAIAEDLFHSAKAKKRGASGTSIYSFLTHSAK